MHICCITSPRIYANPPLDVSFHSDIKSNPSNVPTAPVYGVYISQLTRDSSTCAHSIDFRNRAADAQVIFKQGYVALDIQFLNNVIIIKTNVLLPQA